MYIESRRKYAKNFHVRLDYASNRHLQNICKYITYYEIKLNEYYEALVRI